MVSVVDALKERVLRGVIGATLGDRGFDQVQDGYRALDLLCALAEAAPTADERIVSSGYPVSPWCVTKEA